MPGRPRVPPHEPPRVVLPSPMTPARQVVASPAWSPPPSPAGSTFLSPTPVQAPFQATPRRLDFAGTPSPRVGASSSLRLSIRVDDDVQERGKRGCRNNGGSDDDSPSSSSSYEDDDADIRRRGPGGGARCAPDQLIKNTSEKKLL